MSFWANVFPRKFISDQMPSGQLSFWAIVFLGQFSFWANVFLGKSLSGHLSFKENIFCANVFLGKCLSG
jgi:hypothetical protein